MHLIQPLAAGVSGARDGFADIYVRGTTTRAVYYSSFEGALHPTTQARLQLDSNGGGEVYVNQLVDVSVLDSDGVEVRAFTAGSAATATETIGQSFTGTDYVTGAQAASKPTDVQTVLDRWKDSAGAIDWKVLFNGSATTIENAFGSIAGLFFNVKSPEFGAAGDGTTDDTSAVQNALDAAEDAGGGVVVFPAGQYRVTAKLTVAIGVSLWGFGSEASQIEIDHATTDLLEYGAGSALGSYQEIRNLKLAASGANTGSMVKVTGAGERYVSIVNCQLGGTVGHTGHTVYVGDSTGESHILIDSSVVYTYGDAANAVRSRASNNHYVVCRDSRFVALFSTYSSTQVSGRNVVSRGCTYSLAAAACTSAVCIYNIGDGASYGPRGVFVGNTFIAQFSGTATAIELANANKATTLVTELGSVFTSGFTAPLAGFAAGSLHPQISSQTRETLEVTFAHSSGSLELQADQFGMAIIQQSSNDSFTVNCANLPPAGSRFTLVFFNNSGVNSGTVTFGTGFRALATFTAVTNQLYEVREFRCVVTAAGTALVPIAATVHNA